MTMIMLLDLAIILEFVVLIIPGLFKGEILKSFICSGVLLVCSKLLNNIALDTAKELGYIEGDV